MGIYKDRVRDTEAGNVGTTEHTEHTEAGNVGTTEHTEHTEARGNRLRVVFRGRVEGEWYLSNSSKTQGKHAKVRFLSSPLVKPWFPQGFSHIGIIALAFCAPPCMSMPAGAAPVEIVVSCAALDPKSVSVRRR
jgi:hypothetical protein